jgi:hypothetical protein
MENTAAVTRVVQACPVSTMSRDEMMPVRKIIPGLRMRVM